MAGKYRNRTVLVVNARGKVQYRATPDKAVALIRVSRARWLTDRKTELKPNPKLTPRGKQPRVPQARTIGKPEIEP